MTVEEHHGPAGTVITEAGSRFADPEQDEHPALEPPSGLSNNKMGMWLFLGSECLLFGGLISTYMLYRGRHSGSLGPTRSTTSRSHRCRASSC